VDPKDLEERRHAAEQEADNLKRAAPRITLLNEPLRHHEPDGSLSAESAGELGADDHLDAQANPIEPPDAQR
jgi:hypothetical protein